MTFEGMRQLLHTEWAKLNNLIYQQPLDAIKNYFGEHVGLYFSFLGQYIVFLCVMSVLGIAVFLYGVIYSSVGNSVYLEELKKDDRLLCPKCNRLCDYIPLRIGIFCIFRTKSLIDHVPSVGSGLPRYRMGHKRPNGLKNDFMRNSISGSAATFFVVIPKLIS